MLLSLVVLVDPDLGPHAGVVLHVALALLLAILLAAAVIRRRRKR
jgi:hypothetical protein